MACTSYVKKLIDVGAMQRVMIITLSWASNKEIFAPLAIQDADVLEPSKGALATVIQREEGARRVPRQKTQVQGVQQGNA